MADNLYLLTMRDQTFNINVKHRQLLENFYIINEKLHRSQQELFF